MNKMLFALMLLLPLAAFGQVRQPDPKETEAETPAGSASQAAETAAPAGAAEDAPAEDSGTIAKPPPGPDRYRHLWANSPFLRPLNAAESYVLTGVARFDGKPMVTMVNTATGERISLTTEANPLGWKLLDVQNDPNPRNISARVVINGEEVSIRFNERQLAPDALLKATDGLRRPLPFSTPRAPGSILRERLPKNADQTASPASKNGNADNTRKHSRQKRQKPSQP